MFIPAGNYSTISDVARSMGVARQAVSEKCKKAGIGITIGSTTLLTDEEVAFLVARKGVNQGRNNPCKIA